MVLEPISVALKFGFLAVLYLFLFWVARSALRDLRRARPPGAESADATGVHSAAQGLSPDRLDDLAPSLRVERGSGLREGAAYDLAGGATLGRSAGADIRLGDAFASSRHARIVRDGAMLVLEDLGSTNGTYLNGEPLSGPQPLHPGDRIKIGDSEFLYDQ
jgi:hypothetical protein